MGVALEELREREGVARTLVASSLVHAFEGPFPLDPKVGVPFLKLCYRRRACMWVVRCSIACCSVFSIVDFMVLSLYWCHRPSPLRCFSALIIGWS